MTERKKAEERLNYLAHYDQLTGLPNRVSLQRDLKALIDVGIGPERTPTSIAMLDLEGSRLHQRRCAPAGKTLLRALDERAN
jgi:GGDEF domain-containing protein